MGQSRDALTAFIINVFRRMIRVGRIDSWPISAKLLRVVVSQIRHHEFGIIACVFTFIAALKMSDWPASVDVKIA
jgi:hypothetical protein